MDTSSPEQQNLTEPERDKRKTFWGTYTRLLGYATQHKGKLSVLILGVSVTCVV